MAMLCAGSKGMARWKWQVRTFRGKTQYSVYVRSETGRIQRIKGEIKRGKIREERSEKASRKTA